MCIRDSFGGVDDAVNIERAGRLPEQDDADEETNIADTSRDECLFRGFGGGALLPVEPDEEELSLIHISEPTRPY